MVEYRRLLPGCLSPRPQAGALIDIDVGVVDRDVPYRRMPDVGQVQVPKRRFTDSYRMVREPQAEKAGPECLVKVEPGRR